MMVARMPHPSPRLEPLVHHDGYPPLEQLGLVGDGRAAALVGRDGDVWWLCAPRFDSDPLVCGLLDARRGGRLRLDVEGAREAGQAYLPDTGVLVTDIRGAHGHVRVTDFMALVDGARLGEDAPAARGELVRRVRALSGRARLRVAVEPRGGADVEPDGGVLVLRPRRGPCRELSLRASAPLRDDGRLELAEGESLDLVLRWGPGAHGHEAPAEALERQTVAAWRRWAEAIDYEGPHEAQVRRSAVTLKMLDHFENGALVAAPTSSLPEAIGGPRNWDYRYAWIRDAAFSVYAFRRIGLAHESRGFLGWVLDAVARHGEPRVLYDLDGEAPPPEREDPGLEGYRGSPPVRWGNGAADQRQHDVYGEILDCAWQWARQGGAIEAPLWARLRGLVDAAGEVWREPDHGIWEVRSPGRTFTYSAAMCQVALDRGARLVETMGLPGDAARWRRAAEEVRRAVIEEAWDETTGSLTEHLGGAGGLDASLLALPLRRVLPADHPRMVATTEAVVRRLGAGDGLLYRYLPDESPDGLEGHEGAFLLCSFWLVDNLAGQGRLEEAQDLFDSLCGRAGSLGLLPEQIDPGTGAFLGNHPQAFSHVGLVSSAINLRRRERAAAGRDGPGATAGPG